MSLVVTELILKLDNDGVEEEVHASFSEYGWQQWGARVETLGETSEIWEALEREAADDPGNGLLVLLGIREEDEEE